MNHVSLISTVTEELIAKGAIDADDVLRLRRELWKDGIVSREEAEAVFRLDHACAERAPEWTRFYVDALTDYFVWQAKPRRYVDEESAQFLIDNILGDGRINGSSELELLVNIAYWCESCPESLALFALRAVKESVLAPETAVYGSNRPPAVIGPGDVEIIRRTIYAPGSPGGFTVTQREAELMFELNNASITAENASGWGDLFAKAVANFLMFPRGAPIVLSADEVMSRERWLEERQGVGDLLTNIGKSAARLDIPFREAWEAVDPTGAAQAQREREADEARVREAMSRESIDADEAMWLINQINADGVLHENERKLLAFIRANAHAIDPILQDYMEKAGV